MAKYILKRLLWMIPVVLCVAIFIFTLLYFTPGDPARMIMGEGATEAEYAEYRAVLGIDQPYLVQLGNYLKQLFLKFDLGISFYAAKTADSGGDLSSISITAELMRRLPRTAVLASFSMVLACLVGIPLGVLEATHQDRWPDRLAMIISLIGVSMPQFWIGLMLVLIFALQLGWFPPTGIAEGWKSYILPVIAVSFNGIATLARLMRSNLLDVIRSDYVTTARAKGVSKRAAIIKHAIPNALIPVITQVGSSFAKALGGSVIVETVFSIPGIGLYMVTAIGQRDYPVIRGGVIYLCLIFSFVILLIDIIYAFIDPRIKAMYEKK